MKDVWGEGHNLCGKGHTKCDEGRVYVCGKHE